MSRILVLGRLRRVNHKFEVTLGYIGGERENLPDKRIHRRLNIHSK